MASFTARVLRKPALGTSGITHRSIRVKRTNLRNGRIGSPGLDKLEAIAGAMGFPPQLWFDEEPGDRAPDAALAAALEDEAAREILGEILRMRPRERRLLIGIARQIP